MSDVLVRRVDFGYFIRPGSETLTGRARVEPCLGYLVVHPDGVLLFDTGMGADPDVDHHYRPHRIGLDAALAGAEATLDDVTHVANCHLHFDHCGANPLLGTRPVFVQATELADARTTADYTLPELLDGARYEELSGEILPGVFLIPTPGHTAGHQSLVVRRADGGVICAGQGHDTASDYSADHLAVRANFEEQDLTGLEGLPIAPSWMHRLQQFDPRAVYFAHDHATWVP
jgi:N-acyl homoserine lactone hydrolase